MHHELALAPDDVTPYPEDPALLPQVDAVYADMFIVFTTGVFPSTFAANPDFELLAGFSVAFVSVLDTSDLFVALAFT